MTNRALTIGVIREDKVPVDRRVPLVPDQIKALTKKFASIQFLVQSSVVRCFKDEDYERHGIPVVEDISSCDILFGVKEVPVNQLIPGKIYFFFSHTMKMQPYNRGLLREILKKKITLIDYEALTNPDDHRLVAFGRYAGIVGAYNAIWAYGSRYKLFKLRRAFTCFDLSDLKSEFEKVQLPSIKVVITGSGRVAHGAMETLDYMGIKKVGVNEFLNNQFDSAVYVQLGTKDYNRHKMGADFDHADFISHPENFEGTFERFTKVADVLIAGAYWDPRAPVLFSKRILSEKDFKLKVIADITCDIQGSIPTTVRPSTIDNPLYDYNIHRHHEEPPLSGEDNITVMAIDNLPCELPRDASVSFGEQLMSHVIPALVGSKPSSILEKAKITEDGKLTKRYAYLKDFVIHK